MSGIMYALKRGQTLTDIVRQALAMYAASRGGRPVRVEVNADDLKSYPLDVLDSVPVSPGRSVARGMCGV